MPPGCWVAFAAALLLSAVPVPAAELYVALDGNDANSGAKEAPFRSIERARQAVREQVAAQPRSSVLVLLRGGVYELAQPLTFGPEDSGTETCAVTYAAYPGETVVLSGGQRIAGWKRAEGNRWTADVPDAKSGKRFFRQLTVNDRRAVRARWPNEEGALHIMTVSKDVMTFTFERPLPVGLAGEAAELVVYERWSVTRGLVTSSDEHCVTTATPMGWIGHGAATTASRGKCAFIEHARACLDQPGEWFLDRTNGVITYLAVDGEDPSSMTFVAPVLEQVLRIAGTHDQPVRNLHFRGLCLEHTDFPLPVQGYREIQSAHYGTSMQERTFVQPVGVECTFVQGCSFELCRLAHLGASGIGFGQGCRSNKVVGCSIEDIGGTGVMIGWRGKGNLQSGEHSADWLDPSDAPAANEVANCHIRQCGADSFGAVGIAALFSADTHIVHNLIHDMPYTGISIGFRWDTSPTTQARCTVEYNHIYDVMTKMADGGGLYTLGYQPGTVLRVNHIHGVRRNPYANGAGNNGLYLDAGSKGFLIEDNVVYGAAGESLFLNENQHDWHTWKNNFFDAKPADLLKVVGEAGLEPAYRKILSMNYVP